MERSAQEINIESAASIDAPVDEVWGMMTHAQPVKHPYRGVEEITFRPEGRKRLEKGTEIRLKLGLKVGVVALRGVVRVRIENIDEEQHYFTTSIIEAPLDLQGDATIALSIDPENDGRTELLFMGEFTVSRIMAKIISADKIQHQADRFMPKIGGMIAKQARRSRRGSDERSD
jgi:carbon monoxide dehydrogenase subunit G